MLLLTYTNRFLFVLYFCHSLYNPTFDFQGEDILSFLSKYPISKLSTAEAIQVETFITTLLLQKPVFRASDVFTVGTRLLASMSGTIVTYLLVALQFHATWIQHKKVK
ncbi:hypothetical protein ILUMI_24369 [Ignelater luminosus]|uniref:Uncharacterized protein n=1 Tax=Ignelater luminosus TaxID=2038154 RepID=A0A8K0C770_IGNLU|nr:hypothetical protein ILUMI_24369 [Ignelater luminosus]